MGSPTWLDTGVVSRLTVSVGPTWLIPVYACQHIRSMPTSQLSTMPSRKRPTGAMTLTVKPEDACIASQPDESTVRERLSTHFFKWLGAIPEPGRPQLVVTELRDEPGWDGKVRPIQGVTGPDGSVLAVSPANAHLFDGVEVEDVFADAASYGAIALLEKRLGVPVSLGLPIFRWSARANDLPDAGEWFEDDDPRIPEWLRPFTGGVLMVLEEDGTYQAGVGLKRHNEICREIAVGTDPEHRGQGFATQLVAQAARRIIAEGGVPIYQHNGGNDASGGVADGAGFPDRGWHMLEIHPGASGDIRG